MLVVQADLPERATQSEKGIRSDQCGFSAVDVAQFPILPGFISAFIVGFGSLLE